jgi:3-methyladenine DNA glycosylase AlkD
MPQATEILQVLKSLSLPERAQAVARFFKTGPGDYAQHDIFLGISMPEIHQMAKHYAPDISLEQLSILIAYPEHEARMLAVIILVNQFQHKKSSPKIKQNIVAFYLKNTAHINNWDLVDQSAYKIMGEHCFEHQQDEILLNLSQSGNFWEQRIAVVATLYHIKKSDFKLAFAIINRNLGHPESLMHKANGWMLREIGKQNEASLLDFLEAKVHQCPRTTLRYAIERLSPELRRYFLALKPVG